MNTVAVIVDSLPDRTLTPEETVIKRLDFLDEITACERKRGGSYIMGVNYLRAIADEVGRRYDKNFNAYRNVVASDYQGVECHTIDDIAVVVRNMFLARYPQIFDRYLETKFKNRPYGARVVYFIGPQAEATAFNTLGVEVLASEAVSAYLNGVGVFVDAYQSGTLVSNNLATQEATLASSDSQEMTMLQGLVDEAVVAEEPSLEELLHVTLKSSEDLGKMVTELEAIVKTSDIENKKQNKKIKKSNKNKTLSNPDTEVE